MMLGVEIRDRGAIAVSVDDDGRVIARKEVDGASDRGATALAALDAVAGGAAGLTSVGVAMMPPESGAPDVDVLQALTPRYAGSYVQDGPIPSGAAAAVAEAWAGAARNAQDV